MTVLERSPPFAIDLDIRPLAGRIGAEISNVRLARDLPDAAIAAIEAALAKYKVIFFRNQNHLDDAEQERFAARLGDIVAHPTSPGRAGTAILELDSTDGRGRADRWHTDMTFLDAYPKISVLRGVVIPPCGGDTVWANTVAAYNGLPPALKTLAEGLWAAHSNLYDYSAARPWASAAATKQYEEVFTSTVYETEHPVVRVLGTGERSLVLGFFVRRFVGYSQSDSNHLFEMLQSHVSRLESTARWRWHAGDVAMWDNTATQHCAINDYGDQKRVVRRSTVRGEVPVSVEGRKSVTTALPAVSRIDGATAQAYPTRPITMIVPAVAGGPGDSVGRILGERMRSSLGQPIIIENVGGADGSIAAGRVARAKPDGYTIDLGYFGNHVLNGAVYSLQYDVLNDFAPISPLVMVTTALFARKSLPATDVNELIGWLKANPNKVSMGVVTAGARILSAFFQKETGTQLILVPYRGFPPARQDLVGGQIDLLFDTTDALPLMRAGSIKAYAVANETRLGLARDIPTFREVGLPTLSSWPAWVGFFAPKGTPTEIIGRLNAAVVSALADEGVRSRLIELGFEVFPRERQTPEALGALVKADAERSWPIIKEAGINAE